MQLSLQTFSTMVLTQAAAARTSCNQLIDTSIGSVLRAIFEANASVGLWIQWLITQVLATTRAATSNGVDLDSWIADFGMTRLPATPARGTATFSRLSPGLVAMIPVGAAIRTGTTSSDQLFLVTADSSNPAWSGQGFTVPAGSISIDVPIAAQVPGAAGNVRAGVINQMASAITGIDSVINQAPLAGGLDAETDDAVRSRFGLFLDSRVRATAGAVGFAIESVEQGLSYVVSDRIDASGAARPGNFTVTVDDGSGAPSASLLAAVATAVDAVRPVGSTFSVRGPLVVPVSIVLQVSGPATVLETVRLAVISFVSALPIGGTLTLSRLYQVAHDADQAVTSVSGLLINGAAQDVVPPLFGLLRCSSVEVTT